MSRWELSMWEEMGVQLEEGGKGRAPSDATVSENEAVGHKLEDQTGSPPKRGGTRG